jgi:anaerobic ribonucleoside-triphosphate reductase activating protein
LVSVHDLFDRITALKDEVEGITISGGEPLQQRRPLRALLQRVKQETPLSVMVFTGYTWEEVGRMRDVKTLLACIDVLIAGRYDDAQRLARVLRGSANKTVHLLSDRYTMANLQDIPPAEVIITMEGDVIVTGIEPLRLEAITTSGTKGVNPLLKACGDTDSCTAARARDARSQLSAPEAQETLAARD